MFLKIKHKPGTSEDFLFDFFRCGGGGGGYNYLIIKQIRVHLILLIYTLFNFQFF